MNRIQPKPVRLKLEAEAYEELRQQVLRRDAWGCQWCGSRCELEVHHKLRRRLRHRRWRQKLASSFGLCLALGRLGGRKGGKVRFSKLTPEQRSELGRKAVLARWAKERKSKSPASAVRLDKERA